MKVIFCSLVETKLGSIEIGKLADMIVLSDDLINTPEDKVKNILPVMTIVGGKIMHSESN